MSECYEIEKNQMKIYKQPTLIDGDKNTRLHYSAARGKDEEVIRYLEKEHPLVDVVNYLGWTPLMMTCKNGHLSTAKILLDYGADASRKNEFGMNVFLICIAGRNLELVQLILEHLLVGGISRQFLEMFLSPISLAVILSNFNILKFLIEKKFNLDKRTPETGITPLMFAAATENRKAYSVLLQNGANESLKNYLNHSSQELFAIRRNLQLTEIFSKKKENNSNTDSMYLNLPKVNSQKISPTFSFIAVSSQDSNSTLLQVPNMNYLLPNTRHGSNVSPFFISNPSDISPIPSTPNVESISDNGGQQIFFPPDFSSLFNSLNNSDLLNSRINGSSSIIMSPNLIHILSPRM